MTHTLEVKLKGALLLGAGRAREHHDATLRDPSGAPFIPASALKGAIREQLVRLTDRGRAEILLGGRGYRQDTDDEKEREAPRPERPGGGLTRVYLGDACLEDDVAERFRRGHGYAVRPQVAIDRRGRRAADGLLAQREVVAAAGTADNALIFRAPVDASLLSGSELRDFEGAVRAVFALGSSRSRGLGWVDLKLILNTQAADRPAVEIPPVDDLELVFEAQEPLSLGALPFVSNFQPTLDYLPASTVRGAVVTAALRQAGETRDLTHDPVFRRLFLEPDGCARFGDAIPWGGSDQRPSVAPLTARVGKYGREARGIVDTLMRDYVQLRFAEVGCYVGVRDELPTAEGKEERAVRPGRWLGAARPQRRIMTRLALDRESARGLDGALYSVELIEPGTRFVATVRNAGPEVRGYLERAARVDLRAGHGRGQGYGRLCLVEVRQRDDDPLEPRLRQLDDLLHRRLTEAADAAGDDTLQPGAGHFVAALLVTELVPSVETRTLPPEEAFHTSLALPGSRVLHAEVRANQRGGFDTTAGQPRPFEPVVQAGSVLLLHLPALDTATIERLDALEHHGAGEARDRGFGAVRFSDPIHVKGELR